jgi:hypothetical protein
MSAAQVPDNFWLLADPALEVLIDRRPAFSQKAAVPLHQFGDPMSSAELHLADDFDDPKPEAGT